MLYFEAIFNNIINDNFRRNFHWLSFHRCNCNSQWMCKNSFRSEIHDFHDDRREQICRFHKSGQFHLIVWTAFAKCRVICSMHLNLLQRIEQLVPIISLFCLRELADVDSFGGDHRPIDNFNRLNLKIASYANRFICMLPIQLNRWCELKCIWIHCLCKLVINSDSILAIAWIIAVVHKANFASCFRWIIIY